jgi:FG-GAP-like repeat/HYDIN/CFA65/VesB-like, Ig-like domain
MKRALSISLFFVLASTFALAQNAVPFVLQPLRPVSAVPGMSGLTLTVTGVGFASGATVSWNGSARSTTVVSSTKLTATITAADLAHVGTALITVTNPAPGGGASNVVYFPVHQKTSPGGFARKDTTLSNSVTPYGTFVADFNNDGKLGVIVSYLTGASPTMAVFLGNGDGTFQTPVTTTQSDGSWPVAIGDFNGDGKLDVMTEGNFGTVWFYFGNGDGTFTEQSTFYGPSPATYSVGDINGDGKLDLIVSWGEEGAYGTDVWFGNGDGTFNDVQQLGVGAGLTALSDYNRDGKLDVAVPAFGDLEVAMGRSGGVFNTPVPYSIGGYEMFGLWAGDLNNDGKPDLVSDAGFVFMNNGNGTFTNPSSQSFPGINDVQLIDANGDGKVDILGIAASTQGMNGVGIFPGNGDGTFQSPIVSQTSWGFSALGYGDFNGDGRIDVVTFSQDLVTGQPVMSVFLQNNLHISQSIINYGIVKLGSTSSQTSTLTNTGNSTLALGPIGLSGVAPSYSASTTCGTNLAAGASCDVTINFSPIVNSQASPARVHIYFSGTLGSPQYIELSGMGD